MDEIRIGMVGYKFMGKAHGHAYHDVPMFFPDVPRPVKQVICGRDAAGVAAAQRQFGFLEAETDWRKLIARDDVDVIDVNAPSDAHHEIVLAACKAGKHVFCEKPLALTLSHAREMLAAAEQSGVKHMVGFNYRFAPAVQLAKKLVSEGRLGKIYHFRAWFLQDWIIDPDFPLVWRLQKEVAGSGSHGDLGAHLIDLAHFLVGDMTEVIGMS
ncbi:MAG: Gfo/Idh/MocA family oxidoreductase, partial [Alicyclobacillus sp.]|nr:Gfo/Idh/MocA family oxidoreductase [Alicyclobacillus sp.]